MNRRSTTMRLALAAIALMLVAGLVPVAFLWRATQDDAIGQLRRNTVEQSDALAGVYRREGMAGLRDALDQPADDDATLVAIATDAKGRRLAGTGPDRTDEALLQPGFRIAPLASTGAWSEREAGFLARRIGNGWLVSGRLLDDAQATQRAIARALALSMAVSVLLGVIGGLALTRYVTRRIDGVARTADAVAAGDLARRVAVADPPGDAFDRLGARVNTMLDRIERLMDELKVMTDSIAHDLRSPIARLRARADAALTASDADQRDAALAGLIAETDTVTRMLTTLLEISRSETAGRSGFTIASPADLIDAVAELYEPVVEEAGMAFVVETSHAPGLLLHGELVSQALANLLDNALRYAANGSEIRLTLIDEAREVRLSVADRGPGIAAEDEAEARRRFGRLDPARSKPGAGLGLALVEAVARLHGGRLELADNVPGLIATLVLSRALDSAMPGA